MYRNLGKKAISLFLDHNKCLFIENLIHKCENQEEYKLIIQEMLDLYRKTKDYDLLIKIKEKIIYIIL